MIGLIETNLKKYTFESPKIRKWVEENSTGLVLNLFAGKTKLDLDEIRNDKDVKMEADFHKDALDFVKDYKGEKFDTIILDPPYSYRKSMEMYNNNYSSKFKQIADWIPKITKKDTKIISFGYHSTFMGRKRGYKRINMCVFCHGGAQHCTIAIVEKVEKKAKRNE